MPDTAQMGFLNINKPLYLTSHDVVARIRRRYRELTGSKKVGHAGTLDPLATGVLIICLGGATRLSDYMMHTTKQYRAHITLGKTTDTYDSEGEILSEVDASHIAPSDVENVLSQFMGDIQQIPPMYSAIKIDGKKLYDLAREGKLVEREPREITIHNLEITSFDNPSFELEVTCSSGTYIRSLAYDLGETLGVGGYLSGLKRISSGNFHIEIAIELETIMHEDNWHRHIIPPREALADRPTLTLTDEQWLLIQNGQFIPRDAMAPDETTFAFNESGEFVAIITPRDKFWKPHKVFLRQS